MKSLQSITADAAALALLLVGYILGQARGGQVTRFTCQGRPTGYYADVDTGCQVYHMCDGMGRQFTMQCPNTTLFQQRMLICDHWYMVNCTRSESEYGANLLIGQRDKPFVSDEEMHQRTPRPDILTVPYNNNYYDGLKQAETKYPIPGANSIATGSDSNRGFNSGKTQFLSTTQRPSSSNHFGDGFQRRPTAGPHIRPENNGDPGQTSNQQFGGNQGQQFGEQQFQNNGQRQQFGGNGQSQQFGENSRGQPFGEQGQGQQFGGNGRGQPFGDQRQSQKFEGNDQSQKFGGAQQNFNGGDHNGQQSTVDVQVSSTARTTQDSEEYELDIRMKDQQRPTTSFNFLKRFDPTSQGTAMTTSQILDINRQLPTSFDAITEVTRARNKQRNLNSFQSSANDRPFEHSTRTANTKFSSGANAISSDVKEPKRELELPKSSYSNIPSTTAGPPIYYEWKWAVPAFDLEPPKNASETNSPRDSTSQASESERSALRNITKAASRSLNRPSPSGTNITEYDPKSYFVPDYVFPLDNPHPGYQHDGAHTSFQVRVQDDIKSYGEDPRCPQCHPAYVKQGTCEPCVVRR